MRTWSKAIVTKSLGNRSYEVETSSGQLLRRNRRQLRRTTEGTVENEWHEEEIEDVIGDNEDASVAPRHTQDEQPQQQRNQAGQAERNVGYTTRSGRVSRPPDRYNPA